MGAGAVEGEWAKGCVDSAGAAESSLRVNKHGAARLDHIDHDAPCMYMLAREVLPCWRCVMRW
jgi:hypothetical protein